MLKVLIVDDVELNVKVLEGYVKSYFKDNLKNIRLDYARDGYEALGLHLLNKYDVIFLDVRMPRFDGIKVLNSIRRSDVLKQAHISMVTGIGENKYKTLFKLRGANSFIIKPFKSEHISSFFDLFLEVHPDILSLDKQSKATNDEATKIPEEVEEAFFDFDDFDDFDSCEEFEEVSDEMSKMNETHQLVSAQEFLSEYDTLEYILEDIADIDILLEHIIDAMDQNNFDSHKESMEIVLTKYATFLNSLSSFGELSKSVTILNQQIQDVDLDSLGDKEKYFAAELIRALLEDLSSWKEHVFIEQDANDVFYINASIVSNCMQFAKLVK